MIPAATHEIARDSTMKAAIDAALYRVIPPPLALSRTYVLRRSRFWSDAGPHGRRSLVGEARRR